MFGYFSVDISMPHPLSMRGKNSLCLIHAGKPLLAFKINTKSSAHFTSNTRTPLLTCFRGGSVTDTANDSGLEIIRTVNRMIANRKIGCIVYVWRLAFKFCFRAKNASLL